MRRRAPALLLVVAVVLTAVIATTRRTDGPPFDPRSTAPDGARALVTLLDRSGADVRIIEGPPGQSSATGTAVLLQDRLDRQQAERLGEWVAAGGRVVVADPRSELSLPLAGRAAGVIESDPCDLSSALAGIETIELGESRAFRTAPSDATCFGVGEGAAVAVSIRGEGRIVSVSGPGLWTNSRLGDADNAALAVALLAPEPDTTVWFVEPLASAVGTGDESLVDLIEDPVRALLFQLVIAFVAVVLWRARRLGRPVVETLPVEIESSELTRAAGRLLEANRRPDRAAALLRDRARRRLSGPAGLPLDAPVDVVCRVLSDRTGIAESEVRAAIAGPVRSDEELVACARALHTLGKELLHERPTAV